MYRNNSLAPRIVRRLAPRILAGQPHKTTLPVALHIAV
jgi:hypothetical protein